jgi:S-adenosyl-L-methionine hydrolase (adenosine-forming)
MIALFTDFGLAGPYTGQVKAVLHREAPGIAVIDLFADAPSRAPQPASYLLAAYGAWFPPETVVLAVVDPGVGSERAAIAVLADGSWHVGPDNGLFEIVMRRARQVASFAIAWRPQSLSASFHGRDLFAPVAARLARGEPAETLLRPAAAMRHADWPDDLPQIVYVDVFGNAITGLRANRLPAGARLGAGRATVPRARTFADVPAGAAFWYENANGLAEIAINQGRADQTLGLQLGSAVTVAAAAPT